LGVFETSLPVERGKRGRKNKREIKKGKRRFLIYFMNPALASG
jgi:hypothetical protein